MFLIHLNKINDKNVLDKVYDDLFKSGLITKSYIKLTPDLRNRDFLKYIRECHFLNIEALQLENMEEDIRDDILLDIAALGATNTVDFEGVSEDFIKVFKEVANIFEYNYHVIGRMHLNYIDLQNPNATVLDVIDEIFEIKNENRRYSIQDFMINAEIEHNGDIKNRNGCVVGNVLNDNLMSVLLDKEKMLIDVISNEIEKQYKTVSKYGVDASLCGPWYFLRYYDDWLNNVISYKYSIFNKIKNLTIEECCSLDYRILNILVDHCYIPIDSIKDILNGKHVLLTMDWYKDLVRKHLELEKR